MRLKNLFTIVMLTFVCGPTAPASAQTVLLGFAETYQTPAGESQIHHGVDLAWDGHDIVAPLSGVVTFVGRVPTAEGATVLAVTIGEADRLVTLMPLASAEVVKGQSIAVGARVGELAPEGDSSVSQEHLHVGLRQSGVYIDPGGLYEWPAQTGVSPGEPALATDQMHEPPTVSIEPPTACEEPPCAVSAHPAGEATAIDAAGSQPEMSEQTAEGVQRHGAASTPAGLSSGVGPQARLHEPGAGEAKASLVSSSSAPVGVRGRAVGQGVALGSRIESAAATLIHEPLGLAACLMTAVAVAGLLATRSLTATFQSREPMSHRWLSMLRALRTGDTICGLTSCSGRSAFTDPGPPAQRR